MVTSSRVIDVFVNQLAVPELLSYGAAILYMDEYIDTDSLID